MSETRKHVVVIGLGGIAEGYLWQLASLHETGELPMELLLLVDGDVFEDRNRSRQSFGSLGPKAAVRRSQVLALYPRVPARACSVYVHRGNVRDYIPEGAIVLLSPDNQPTRKLVSDHVKGLDECLLIVGGNDAIDEVAGTDGTEGYAMVHYRKEGRDLTAPIDLYHPEIATDHGPEPTALSCGALLAQGQRQVRRTNLMVGHCMLNLLLRYLQMPCAEAVQVGEVVVSSRTESVVPYDRPPLDRTERE